MALRPRLAGPIAVVATALALLPAAASAAVGDITEFSVPTGASDPESGEIGPDGNFWFAEYNANKIGRVTPAGVFGEFSVTAGANPVQTAVGSDRNIWFTEFTANKVGKMTTAGTLLAEYSVTTAASGPEGITKGPDGNIWFTEVNSNRIGEITTTGTVTEYVMPTAGSGPNAITTGPDGKLWVAELNTNKIAQVDKASVIANTSAGIVEFNVPTAGSSPLQTIGGVDGNVWFTESDGNKIGRITPAGAITEFPVPTANSQPHEMAPDADGNIWFTEGTGNKIGRLGANGQMDEFTVTTVAGYPEGIRIGSDGNVWFTEADANKIGKLIRVAAPLAGTDPASAVGQGGATLNGTLNPQGLATSLHFEYGATAAYGSSTPTTSANPSVRATAVSSTIIGLAAGTTYHARLVATNSKGTTNGPDVTFTTAAAPAAPAPAPRAVPPPVFSKAVDAAPVSGTVLVRVPGSSAFVPLSEPTQIQVGSIIDARKGRVRITIVDRNGRLWSADFYQGMFQITQLAKDKGVADLKLVGGSFRSCKAGTRSASAATSKPKSIRHLWGSGSGPFRTHARFASATVRGTTWKTDDRCDGTLVKVTSGAVTVRDFVKRRSRVVRARHQYLARARP